MGVLNFIFKYHGWRGGGGVSILSAD